MLRKFSTVSAETWGLSRSELNASPPADDRSANVTAETIKIIIEPWISFRSSSFNTLMVDTLLERLENSNIFYHLPPNCKTDYKIGASEMD